ncbi:MAG: ImmA/IrrE family metallo-endopeptidase [Bacteroidales bacterium]|nr:ImmA/IrrE family metallo-endopeptidase [Bacteroidales bacterium]
MSVDVPFLKASVIEAEANLLLAEFGKAYGEVVEPPVTLDEIIELHLGLYSDFMDMKTEFGHSDIHGAIFFHEKMIAVDMQFDPKLYPNKRGRYRFTLAHETGHWCLHRKHFLRRGGEQFLFDGAPSKPDFVCRSSEKKKPVEWQADTFAAYLLMPRTLVKDAWEQWRGEAGAIALSEIDDTRKQKIITAELLRRGGMELSADAQETMILEHLSRPLAEQFAVSAPAMRIRLEDLGFLVRKKEVSLFD